MRDCRPQLAPGEVELVWCPAPERLNGPRAEYLDGLLRQVLSQHVAVGPEQLIFAREPRGRPFLVDHGSELSFSLSDTVGGSVVAVTCGLRVGVDLERSARTPDALRLASRYFAADEAEALRRLPESLRARAFVYAWTAKESACKATGTGLAGRLARWRFVISAEAVDPELLAAPPEAGDPAGWQLRRIEPAPGYTAVVAAAGEISRLRLISLTARTQAS